MGVEKQLARIKELAESKIKDQEQIYNMEKSLFDHILLMEEILHSIPDVVGVIRPDYSIAFFNRAGYEQFNICREEVRKRKCYEILNRTEKCENCRLEEVIKNKKEITCEMFVNELGKFIEFFYKPVFDNDGNLDLIIWKMRNITNQKVIEKQLQMQEKTYRRLFEFSPYGILIVQDGEILMFNSEIIKMLGYKEEELKKLTLRNIVHNDYIQRAEKTLKSLNNEKMLKVETELILNKKDGKKIFADITASKIDFLGITATQVTIRDTSKLKAEMDKASKIQKVRMQRYPVDLEKIKFETVYVPKNIVSGDFFHIFRTGENEMVGFLGDSNGSGVSAALLNSAVKVIINDVITKTTDPEKFLNMIDDEFKRLFEEDFVSAICFKIDFAEQKIIVTSAGINEYIIERKKSPTISLLKGPPIGGKIKGASFDTMTHDFLPGDRIYLFTDGFDENIQNRIFKEKVYKEELVDQKEFIRSYFAKPDNIKDDVLWVGVESL